MEAKVEAMKINFENRENTAPVEVAPTHTGATKNKKQPKKQKKSIKNFFKPSSQPENEKSASVDIESFRNIFCTICYLSQNFWEG